MNLHDVVMAVLVLAGVFMAFVLLAGTECVYDHFQAREDAQRERQQALAEWQDVQAGLAGAE